MLARSCLILARVSDRHMRSAPERIDGAEMSVLREDQARTRLHRPNVPAGQVIEWSLPRTGAGPAPATSDSRQSSTWSTVSAARRPLPHRVTIAGLLVGPTEQPERPLTAIRSNPRSEENCRATKERKFHRSAPLPITEVSEQACTPARAIRNGARDDMERDRRGQVRVSDHVEKGREPGRITGMAGRAR